MRGRLQLRFSGSSRRSPHLFVVQWCPSSRTPRVACVMTCRGSGERRRAQSVRRTRRGVSDGRRGRGGANLLLCLVSVRPLVSPLVSRLACRRRSLLNLNLLLLLLALRHLRQVHVKDTGIVGGADLRHIDAWERKRKRLNTCLREIKCGLPARCHRRDCAHTRLIVPLGMRRLRWMFAKAEQVQTRGQVHTSMSDSSIISVSCSFSFPSMFPSADISRLAGTSCPPPGR